MKQFVPRQKLSKKAQRELDKVRRASWGNMSPLTRKIESKKAYKRRKPLDRNGDYGRDFFIA